MQSVDFDIFPLSQPTNSEPLKWSARLKNSSIRITGKSAIRMTDWVNRFGCFGVCCLANGAFEGEQHKWAIRVSAMKRWIIIGICQIEKAEENQFEERGFKESMHGHYCVVSNGFVFSHSDAEVNSTVKSFKFRKGNVLQFEYKPELAKLIVTKDNNERIETVFKIEVGKKYAPFVYFIDSEDSVKLIEQ